MNCRQSAWLARWALMSCLFAVVCGCSQPQGTAGPDQRVDQLQRENESLRRQVESLREQNRARAQLLERSGEDSAQLQQSRQSNRTLREECAGITADLQQQVQDLQARNRQLDAKLRETVEQLTAEQNRRAKDIQNCERRLREVQEEVDRLKR